MAKKSAPAGTYILTGVMWRQFHDDGSQTVWEQGDEVELTEKEAIRFLMGEGPRKAFKPKDAVDKPFKNTEAPDDSSSAPLTPENASGDEMGGTAGNNPINPGSKGPGSPN
jgi:hypothetical protein